MDIHGYSRILGLEISMDIHGYPHKNDLDMDMDMDSIFHIHGKPGILRARRQGHKKRGGSCHIYYCFNVPLPKSEEANASSASMLVTPQKQRFIQAYVPHPGTCGG